MSTSSSKRIYNTKKWQQTRAKVIAAEPVCHWCRKKKSSGGEYWEPHHMIFNLFYW